MLVRLFRSARDDVAALIGYVVAAVVFCWPLPAHLSTRLAAIRSHDAGVYVWNLWAFRHELVDERSFPLFTDAIFSLDGGANLGQHNYTLFADLLAVPLIPLVGVVASFNLLYLSFHVLTGYATFVLARHVAKSASAAWLAGLAAGFAPFLVARGETHFSLVAAAPLALFTWLLFRSERDGGRPSALGLGLGFGWAALCDPYYAIYAALIAAFHFSTRLLAWSPAPPRSSPRRIVGWLDAAILAVGGLVAWIAATGGGDFAIGGARVSVRGLNNPVFVLTLLVAGWIWRRLPVRPHVAFSPEAGRLLRAAPWALVSALLALWPIGVAIAFRVSDGRFVNPPIFWRTSPHGLDLAALVAPNPVHPLWRTAPWARWLGSLEGGFVENVASMPFALVLVIAAGAWAGRGRISRYWLAFSGWFGLLALGPFVRVAGLDTWIPTPWALLRYVPPFGWARTPTRIWAVATLGLAVLFALGLKALFERWPARRVAIGLGVGLVLALELFPAPRPLFPAELPDVYRAIVADPRPIRVLELPFGIRDGVSSSGDFSAASQFFQTFHAKRLIGGYLSRVSPARTDRTRRHEVLGVIMELSEGRTIAPERLARARRMAPGFIGRSRLGYVIVDRHRAPAGLERAVVELLDLKRIDQDHRRTVYVPRPPVRVAW